MDKTTTRKPGERTALRPTPRPAGPSPVVRLLAGRDTWGLLRTGYARHWVQFRLGVYPPGIDERARLDLRVWDACTLWAPVLAFVLWTVGLFAGVPSWIALAVAGAVVAGLVVLAARRVRQTRRRVHWLVVWLGDPDDATELEGRARVLRLAGNLRKADRDLRSGAITAVEHEVIWTGIYDSIS